MRNLLMKKFGTPTGTGPMLARESVGFCSVGRPLGKRSLVFSGSARSGFAARRRRPAESKTGWPTGLPFFLPRLDCASAAGALGRTGVVAEGAAGVAGVGLIDSSGAE